MMTPNILSSLIILVISFVITPNNAVMAGQSVDNSEYQSCIQKSFHNKQLVAQDAIRQTIHDLQDLIKFINTIPQLKSLPKSKGELEKLKDCVAGLVGNITMARSRLTKMRHLNYASIPNVVSNSKHLKSAMNEAVSLQGQVCHIALEDVDRTITSMLSRKLLHVTANVDDILYLVYQLKLVR